MSSLNNNLFLIWKDPKTRRNYVVGELLKNGNFKFKYSDSVSEAIEAGFSTLIGFDDLNKVYENSILFPAFSSRIPDKKRKDIQAILNKYGLEEYDEFLLLKNCGAKLPIDTLEFEKPLEFPIDTVIRVAGTRHYLGCNPENLCDDEECKNGSINLKVNDRVTLEPEPTNPYDKDAIKITTDEGKIIGYIPRYFSKDIVSLLQKDNKVTCYIKEFNGAKPCEECVKIYLKIESLDNAL